MQITSSPGVWKPRALNCLRYCLLKIASDEILRKQIVKSHEMHHEKNAPDRTQPEKTNDLRLNQLVEMIYVA